MAISFQFILAVLHGCRILVPQPEIEPMIHAVEAWSHNHWTAREVPRYISCFTYSNQLSWFLLSTSPTSPVISFYFLFISGNIMFQLLKPKPRFLRLLSVCFSLPTPQKDLHVLPPKNEFNHVSAFFFFNLFHITRERAFQLVQLCLFLNHPPNLFSNLQPENGLPVMLPSYLNTFQWFPIASSVIPASVPWSTRPSTAWPSLPFLIHLLQASFSDYSCLSLFHLLSLLRQTKVFLASGYFYLFFPLPEAVLVRHL